MKLGIVLTNADAESSWNAFRFANFSLKKGDEVRVFLIGHGVDYERHSSEKFDSLAQARQFADRGGKIFACGTCLKSRNEGGSDLCPVSTMQDLYDIVSQSDRVLSF